MSLLQSPRRSSSDVLALASTGRAFDPDLAFPGSDGLRDEVRVDLARELDLSSERPHASAPAGRGPGLLVASIVASSLVLAGIIMLVRGGPAPVQPDEPAAPAPIAEGVSAPAQLPATEAAPVEVAPAQPPSRVASQSVPAAAAKKEPSASAEITPAAIAPASPSRPTAPATATEHRPLAPAEVAPEGGLAPGLHLPAPVFDEPEPAAPVEPPTPPAPSPNAEDGASDLPGIEERPPAEPEAPAAVPEAAERSLAVPPAPALDGLDVPDHLPARADRPAP